MATKVIPEKPAPTYHIQGSIGPSGGFEKMIIKTTKCKTVDIYVFPTNLANTLSKADKSRTAVEFIAKMFRADLNNSDSIISVLRSLEETIGTKEANVGHLNKSTMTDSKITSPHPPKLFAERNRICMTQNHPGPVLPVLEDVILQNIPWLLNTIWESPMKSSSGFSSMEETDLLPKRNVSINSGLFWEILETDG
jgi:hypothetical protein